MREGWYGSEEELKALTKAAIDLYEVQQRWYGPLTEERFIYLIEALCECTHRPSDIPYKELGKELYRKHVEADSSNKEV